MLHKIDKLSIHVKEKFQTLAENPLVFNLPTRLPTIIFFLFY